MSHFATYVRFGRAMGKEPCPPGVPLRHPKGEDSAVYVFNQLDTHGIKPTSCKHPRLLQVAEYGKASLNFHITDVWGSNLKLTMKEAGLMVVAQEIQELALAFPYLPQFVWKALIMKAAPLIARKVQKAVWKYPAAPDLLERIQLAAESPNPR